MISIIFLFQPESQNTNIFLEYFLPILTVFGVFANLTILVYLNTKSFKHEYHKKIIEKRIAAYERIEILLTKMRLYRHYDDKCCYLFCSSPQQIKEIRSEILSIGKNGLYLSVDTINILIKLSEYLTDNIYENKDISASVQLGIKHFNNLSKIISDIQLNLYKDMRVLYDVDKFFKEKYNYSSEIKKKDLV